MHIHTHTHCKNMHLNASFFICFNKFCVKSKSCSHNNIGIQPTYIMKATSENDLEVLKYHISPNQYFNRYIKNKYQNNNAFYKSALLADVIEKILGLKL